MKKENSSNRMKMKRVLTPLKILLYFYAAGWILAMLTFLLFGMGIDLIGFVFPFVYYFAFQFHLLFPMPTLFIWGPGQYLLYGLVFGITRVLLRIPRPVCIALLLLVHLIGLRMWYVLLWNPA